MIDDFDPPEWEAQERERARATGAVEPAGSDARDLAYRQIARALRNPAPMALPGDFAAHVAARVATEQFTRFEALLMAALVTTLAALAVGLTMRFGGQWLLEVRANGWALAFAGCIAAQLTARWPRAWRADS